MASRFWRRWPFSHTSHTLRPCEEDRCQYFPISNPYRWKKELTLAVRERNDWNYTGRRPLCVVFDTLHGRSPIQIGKAALADWLPSTPHEHGTYTPAQRRVKSGCSGSGAGRWSATTGRRAALASAALRYNCLFLVSQTIPML